MNDITSHEKALLNTWMTDFPTLSYTSARDMPTQVSIYLKREKGTPFGPSLLV